jgi:hypothetical protein
MSLAGDLDGAVPATGDATAAPTDAGAESPISGSAPTEPTAPGA